MINIFDYGVVSSTKKMKESGLSVGDTVLVIANKVLPVTKSDPYLQRVYVVCILVKEGVHQMPSEDTDYVSFLIDPRNLTKVDEDTTKDLRDKLEHQYNGV